MAIAAMTRYIVLASKESDSSERVPSFGYASALSPTPSPSESVVSVASFGNASSESTVPAPSESHSIISLASPTTTYSKNLAAFC